MQKPTEHFGVFVSLPRNDIALAQSAMRAGADGLKVHVSMSHRASGNSLGTFEDERARLKEILDLGLPVGVVVGSADRMAQEIPQAARYGFDYIDLYASDAPVNYVELCQGATPMVALGPGDGADQARALVDLGVGALELSTLEPERYGTQLSLGTLARLESVTSAVEVPVIVPTQHHILPSDLPLLQEAGAAGVLLGAVVLGENPEAYEEVTRQYTNRS